MGCVKCEEGYWICTNGMADCDENLMLTTTKGCTCYHVADAGVYTIWCRQGCQEVVLATGSYNPSGKQWVRIGVLRLETGDYAVRCGSGGGYGTCNVTVRLVTADNNLCDCAGKGIPPHGLVGEAHEASG